MTSYNYLTNEQLEAEVERLREEAHKTPLNPTQQDHKGRRSLKYPHDRSWAVASQTWMNAADELDRRLKRGRYSEETPQQKFFQNWVSDYSHIDFTDMSPLERANAKFEDSIKKLIAVGKRPWPASADLTEEEAIAYTKFIIEGK